MKIAEVKTLDDKDIIPEISGMLTAVYDRKEGEGANGKWSLQNCELSDESDKIKLILSNRPEMPRENKGRNVVIKCHKGDKGKSGLYAKDDTYNGVTTRKIRVTGTGRFIFDGEGSESPNGSDAKPQGAKLDTGPFVSKAVFGATVGMALNNAVHVLLKACEGEGIAYYKSDVFREDLHQIASTLVRVSQQMETGGLWEPVLKDNVVEAAKELFQAEDENQEEAWT